jgi:iron complex outermembrane receptor protein
VDVLSGTTVLTGDDLARELRPTLGDTLARQPGVSSTSFGPNASRPILRGFQGDRIRVLTDGIGSIDVSTTSVDHAPVVNPLLAERIEVLRGPAALLFGSSAIGGVVNVVDGRIARRMPEAPLHTEAVATYGSASEERSAAGKIDVPIGPMIVAHVDASYTRSDNLRTGGYLLSPELRALAAASPDEEIQVNAKRRGTLPNSAAETWEVAAGLSVVTDRGHLGFSVSRYDSLYGVPPRLGFQTPEDGAEGPESVRFDLKQTRLDVRGELETDGEFLEKIRVRMAAADYRHFEIEESGEIGTRFFNQGYEGRFELVQANRGGWQGASGGQMFIRDFDVQGDEKFVPRNTTMQFGFFTLQSLDLGAAKLEAGARYERTNLTAQPDADLGTDRMVRSFNAFSGSIGASYALAPAVRIGLNASRTERAPSAEELFANGPHAGTQTYEFGDPNFAKESSWGLEATMRATITSASLDLSAFYNRFSNYIYQAPAGQVIDGLPAYRYAQADAIVWGFEAQAQMDLAEVNGWTISADGLADYVRTQITGVGPAPRIPPMRILGGLAAKAGATAARIEIEHAFSQARISEFELPTDAYTLVNASVTLKPFGSSSPVGLVLSANNIFDVEARRHASFIKDFAPMAGRDLRASVRVMI